MGPPLGKFAAEPRLTTTESEILRDSIEATGIVPTSPLVRPSISETVDPNSIMGKALNYQQMSGVNTAGRVVERLFDVSAAGRVRQNVRLFGTTPTLGGFLAFEDPVDLWRKNSADPWESAADPVSDKATADPVSEVVALERLQSLQSFLEGLNQSDEKMAQALKDLITISVVWMVGQKLLGSSEAADDPSRDVALVRRDPGQFLSTVKKTIAYTSTVIISAGLGCVGTWLLVSISPIAFVVSAALGVISIAYLVLRDSQLAALSEQQRLALNKDRPALAEVSGQDHPHRSSPKDLIPILAQEILQSITKEPSDPRQLFRKIKLLGVILGGSTTTPAEFMEGFQALLKTWLPSEAENFLGKFFQKIGEKTGLFFLPKPKVLFLYGLEDALLTALDSALSQEGLNLSDPAYQNRPFTSMAVRALEELKKADVPKSRIKRDSYLKLLRAFAKLLGKDHPEIKKTSIAINKLEVKLMKSADEDGDTP